MCFKENCENLMRKSGKTELKIIDYKKTILNYN